jgi:hypothetical protein
VLIKFLIAQMDAGTQPIRMACKMRHEIPSKIFPLAKKYSQGKTMARKVIGMDLTTPPTASHLKEPSIRPLKGE